MRPRHALAAAFATLALPDRAAACAVCLGAAFGDRSYTWPYLGLILLPFIVGGAILGALAWQFGWRPRDVAARLSTAFRTEGARPPRTPWRRAAPADPSPRTHTETT